MAEWYAEVRFAHVAAVVASGLFFLLRGVIVALGGGARIRVLPVRLLSYSIDTVLLATALILTTIVEQYPFVHAWLTVKVVLLVVYIVLGYLAFWKVSSPMPRTGLWFAALLVYGYIAMVALARDPLGFLA